MFHSYVTLSVCWLQFFPVSVFIINTDIYFPLSSYILFVVRKWRLSPKDRGCRSASWFFGVQYFAERVGKPFSVLWPTCMTVCFIPVTSSVWQFVLCKWKEGTGDWIVYFGTVYTGINMWRPVLTGFKVVLKLGKCSSWLSHSNHRVIFYILSEGYFKNWACLLSVNLVEAVQENTFYYFFDNVLSFFLRHLFSFSPLMLLLSRVIRCLSCWYQLGMWCLWPSNFIGYVP